MQKNNLISSGYLVLLVITLVTSCKGQSAPENEKTLPELLKREASQIGDYVVETFEDAQGNLWFGTLEKGIAKYDGASLRYYTTEDGLPSNRVVSVEEDQDGNLWFGTGTGISKYDGQKFTNFTERDGLCHNSISSLLIDKKGILWIGTWNGVCTFDGNTFTKVTIPKPDIKTPINKDTKNWVTVLFEDSKGAIWVSRDGYGITRYDGRTYTHFTKTDGLASNNVQAIEEDAQGHLWFGSRVGEKDHPNPEKRQGTGGLNRYDGTRFTSFPNLEGLHHNDVYQIYKDAKGNLWMSTLSNGIYRYDGEHFTNYPVVDPVTKKSKASMSFLEDRQGTLWIGCAGGLFKLTPEGAVNITTEGPWN